MSRRLAVVHSSLGLVLLVLLVLSVVACGDRATGNAADAPTTTLFRNQQSLDGAPFVASAIAAVPGDALGALEGTRLNRAEWWVEGELRFEEVSFVGSGVLRIWWQDLPAGDDVLAPFRDGALVEDRDGITLYIDEGPGPGGGMSGLYRATNGSVIVSVLAVDVRGWDSDRARNLVTALLGGLVGAP